MCSFLRVSASNSISNSFWATAIKVTQKSESQLLVPEVAFTISSVVSSEKTAEKHLIP
jgi:hypothetical protein